MSVSGSSVGYPEDSHSKTQWDYHTPHSGRDAEEWKEKKKADGSKPLSGQYTLHLGRWSSGSAEYLVLPRTGLWRRRRVVRSKGPRSMVRQQSSEDTVVAGVARRVTRWVKLRKMGKVQAEGSQRCLGQKKILPENFCMEISRNAPCMLTSNRYYDGLNLALLPSLGYPAGVLFWKVMEPGIWHQSRSLLPGKPPLGDWILRFASHCHLQITLFLLPHL